MYDGETPKNLTFSIDKALLEKARKSANAVGLSLNEMIRRYLEEVVGVGGKAGTFQELRELCLNGGGHSRGRTWSRTDLHRG